MRNRTENVLSLISRSIGWISWLGAPILVWVGWPWLGTGLLAIGVLGWAYEK